MTLANDDMNGILDYLTRNDNELDGESKLNKMDNLDQDSGGRWAMLDPWQQSDDLLENIFSLDHGSLNLLEDASMPDFALAPDDKPSEGLSSSCSDSGLSSDPAEFDFEQQLSPFLIQNSCDEDLGAVLEPASPALDVVVQDCSSSSSSADNDAFDMLDFEQNVVPGFINSNTFQTPVRGGRKRRLSQTPQVVVQPKIQKPTVKSPPAPQKPQLIVKAQPQKPVKVANIQVINPQPRVYSKPVESVAPQRRVIRVAPMAGNPRSILLPVTIKDMKDLKSIKIISASDLKNAQNIKLAAANLLSQSKQQEMSHARNDDYESNGNQDDSGSDHSDDDDDKETQVPDGKNGYPRLVLTAEERRLLAKEGISLPTSYPLTKHEERELKRIRRKIRNKISAQDSRKRKKEYVDGLEDRVKKCTSENQTLIRRIKILQSQNQSLTTQLKRLQKVLTGVSTAGGKPAPPATCLLVLLLSVALVALPSLRDARPGPAPAPAPAAAHALTRALLSATNKMTLEEAVLDDGEFNMEELITFNRAHSDHDYQVVKPAITPPGYRDLPVDDDWPPHLKRRKYPDPHLPPIVKEENYQHFDSKIKDLEVDEHFFSNNLLTGKIGDMFDVFPPIPVKNEDILIEEVSDYDDRNSTEVKSFVVNNVAN